MIESVAEGMRQAGFEKHLALTDGRGSFCFTRKLAPDGLFDRQLERDGCRFCYYLNRIWDNSSANNDVV